METYTLEGFGDQQKNRETEWLLTNGIGGFASGTVMGGQTRKYHGYLLASFNPPVERYMMLSRITEAVTIENREFLLSAFDIDKNEFYETDCLKTFVKDEGVHWHYNIGSHMTLSKHLYLLKGENTAFVKYEIESDIDGVIDFVPEVSMRGYHEVSNLNDSIPTWKVNEKEKQAGSICNELIINTEGIDSSLKLKLDKHSGTELLAVDQWVGPYYLANEAERGLQVQTYAYVPFKWRVKIPAGERVVFSIGVTTEGELPLEPADIQIEALKTYYEKLIVAGEEQIRESGLLENHLNRDSSKEELHILYRKLLVAADDFIVKRQSTGKETILAGYPWFTDWGRDSMISLPGLTLSAGQAGRFREIYETFESYMKNGVLPNVFPETGDEPRYNTVDATLWMSIAMWRYYQETQDLTYVKDHFLPTLKEIIHHYSNGTLNNTYMDTDGLIWSGDETTQLTWMDVKVNGWVVTPRHGKAVEINALWYNTLEIAIYFATLLSQEYEGFYTEEQDQWKSLAEQVKISFAEAFWNDLTGYLNDVVRDNEVLTMIRPNQIFAISLPFPLIEGESARKVFAVVTKHLLIPYGLRSLSDQDPEYHGTYGGDVLARDGAYHRGTGWGWLIGPYLDAYNRVESPSNRALESFVLEAGKHLDELCLGQYCENFDGDKPYHGRGCMAQAWSVAELLRWVRLLIQGGNRDKV